MRIKKYIVTTCCLLAAVLAHASLDANAGYPFNLINFLSGKSTDLKAHSCEKCGHSHGKDEYCIARHKVEECVVGKKRVFKTKIKYEWVSIPETRYQWKKMLITEEVDCPYCCKPVCKTEDCERCAGREVWKKHGDECNEIHCRHIEPIMEKGETKHCEHEEGETTVRVKYWSTVKVPYTVYRQVKQPVGVKQSRFIKAKVKITRYVCHHCRDTGCNDCGYPVSASDFDPDDEESDDEDSDSESDDPESLPAPTDAEPIEEEERSASRLPRPVIISDSF